MYTHESSNNIEDSCNGELKPAFNNNNIAIAFASDNNYVKYLSVAIISLTDNMSKDYNYDIVILEDKIKDKSKLLLLEQVKDFKNVSLRFIDINRYFDKYKNVEFYTLENISYITKSMYSRFFIPKIFYNYNKVLYLDVDTLINDNLVELYQTDLENYLIAGAIHIENNPTFNYFNREITIKESNRLQKLYNIKNYSNFFYINSGVILYNIYNCNKYNFTEKNIKFIKLHDNALYPDQDAINKICYNKIYYIDQAYNFNSIFFDTSEISPKILRFYGPEKPLKLSTSININLATSKWIKIYIGSPFFNRKNRKKFLFTSKSQLIKCKILSIRYKVCRKIYKSKKRVKKYEQKIIDIKNTTETLKDIIKILANLLNK